MIGALSSIHDLNFNVYKLFLSFWKQTYPELANNMTVNVLALLLSYALFQVFVAVSGGPGCQPSQTQLSPVCYQRSAH